MMMPSPSSSFGSSWSGTASEVTCQTRPDANAMGGAVASGRLASHRTPTPTSLQSAPSPLFLPRSSIRPSKDTNTLDGLLRPWTSQWEQSKTELVVQRGLLRDVAAWLALFATRPTCSLGLPPKWRMLSCNGVVGRQHRTATVCIWHVDIFLCWPPAFPDCPSRCGQSLWRLDRPSFLPVSLAAASASHQFLVCWTSGRLGVSTSWHISNNFRYHRYDHSLEEEALRIVGLVWQVTRMVSSTSRFAPSSADKMRSETNPSLLNPKAELHETAYGTHVVLIGSERACGCLGPCRLDGIRAAGSALVYDLRQGVLFKDLGASRTMPSQWLRRVCGCRVGGFGTTLLKGAPQIRWRVEKRPPWCFLRDEGPRCSLRGVRICCMNGS